MKIPANVRPGTADCYASEAICYLSCIISCFVFVFLLDFVVVVAGIQFFMFLSVFISYTQLCHYQMIQLDITWPYIHLVPVKTEIIRKEP